MMIFSKTGITLAFLLASTSITFASEEHKKDDSHESAAPKRSYKLVRDKDRPHTLAALAKHPAVIKGKAAMEALKSASATLPAAYDMRSALATTANKVTLANINSTIFPVYDQGQLGSCTANAAAGGLQYKNLLNKVTSNPTSTTAPSAPTPSRLFIYWNERCADTVNGTDVTQDTGASIADSILAIATCGACPELGPTGYAWPYSDTTTGKNPPFTIKPPVSCYTDALKNMDTDKIITNILEDSDVVQSFKTALSANNPVFVGIDVYKSFESAATAKTGIVQMPNTSREQLLGGHALMITGYDDTKKTTEGKLGMFTVRNSWGTGWGDLKNNPGYCYIPYDYFMPASNLASDFWSIGSVGSVTGAPIKFSVTATTNYGQNVYVSGNIPELGCWDPSLALPLTFASSAPKAPTKTTWVGNVTLSPNQFLQYKYIIQNTPTGQKGAKVQWLGGPNLSMTTTSDKETVASYHWM